MYNNSYAPIYPNSVNQQSMNDRIDNQIAQLQQMKEQIKNNYNQQQQQNHQPAINQTFQLAPTGMNTIRYANTIDDVNKEVVYGDTAYFSKDMSVVWIKNSKNEIRTYELTEIIQKDDKDMQIEYLQAQIEELKGKIENEWNNTNANKTEVPEYTKEPDKANGGQIKSSKSSGVSRISKSKTE